MDWVLENWQAVLVLVTVVVVAAVVLYQRYKDNRGQLYADLEVILRDGLEYLKGWAGDRMEEVTEKEVHEVADKFFDMYIAGKLLAGIITRERLRKEFWQRFCQWRDWFVSQARALEA